MSYWLLQFSPLPQSRRCLCSIETGCNWAVILSFNFGWPKPRILSEVCHFGNFRLFVIFWLFRSEKVQMLLGPLHESSLGLIPNPSCLLGRLGYRCSDSHLGQIYRDFSLCPKSPSFASICASECVESPFSRLTLVFAAMPREDPATLTWTQQVSVDYE